MSTEADIYTALEAIFADVFMRDDIRLSAATTAKDVAGWDSFKQVEIFRTLGDLVAAILRRGS
jgi:acyl carrier protein